MNRMSVINIAKKGDEKTFVIPNGADGSAVDPVILDDTCKALAIYCEDAQYIAAATTLSALVSPNLTGTMVDLHEIDTPGTAWVSETLPTSGGFYVVLTHTFGGRRFQPVLSNNASGGSVTLTIIGLDGFN